ncbi:hypothetical protein [Chitinophaga deserti]|nr:hypothetical protein [Chitinophaga deserti]
MIKSNQLTVAAFLYDGAKDLLEENNSKLELPTSDLFFGCIRGTSLPFLI